MWHAKFIDGTFLSEYSETGEEILFGEVMRRVGDLESLSIILQNGKIFTVRLRDGRFTVDIDGKLNHFYGFDIEKYDVTQFKNIRPIYFMREVAEFAIGKGPGGVCAPRTVFTAVGFQANHAGENLKVYLAIYPDGKYIVRTD